MKPISFDGLVRMDNGEGKARFLLTDFPQRHPKIFVGVELSSELVAVIQSGHEA